MCKLKSGRLNREVSDSCLQFWGGMGFTNDVLVSRMYRLVGGMNSCMSNTTLCRDMRLTSIAGGADEVMLGIICKYMGILPKKIKK